MIQLPLTLRFVSRITQPAAAWFIPGHDPAVWLAHLSDSFSNCESPDLYLLPRSIHDRTACGLLVIPSNPAVCHPSPLLMSFRRLANLYLPVDAQPWPPVNDPELASFLHCEINVLHPTIGLVGFSRTERLSISQFLAPLPRRDSDWTIARPGLPPTSRLTAVLPLRLPDTQSIINQGRDDIGEAPLEQAPPPPKEPTSHPILKAAATAPIAAAATMLQKLAAFLQSKGKAKNPQSPPGAPSKPGSAAEQGDGSGAGAGASGSGLANWLGDLVNRGAKALRDLTPGQFAALAASMDYQRNKEINRLLHLLQNNPDEGLRYALPLAGSPGRGLAAPSDRLDARNTNFSLNSLGGSGRADPWSLSDDAQQKLRAHYRRLAAREIQLGRHRRAAYIFAQLLGDFSSAANALKQGRHYREAAALYRDRLNSKLAAADCLHEGGLPLEAIPLYEELQMFERVAELYTLLNQPEQAAQSYRKAVDQCISRDDRLKAAALLENKLAVPREALATLDSAWPNKSDASLCVSESFRLLARLKDFEEAQGRIKKLRSGNLAGLGFTRVAAILSEVATTFPEDATRLLAVDSTRVVIGKGLRAGPATNARTLTDLLPQLSPDDRLLPRDAQRYHRLLVPAVPKPPARSVQLGTAPANKSFPIPTLLQKFYLPQAAVWQHLTSSGAIFYAIAQKSGTVLQGDWNGNFTLRSPAIPLEGPFAFSYSDNHSQLVAVEIARGRHLDNEAFPPREDTDRVKINSSFLPANLFAVTCDTQGNVWALHNEESSSFELALSAYDPAAGKLLNTHAVNAPLPGGSEVHLPIPLVARSNHIYIALDSIIHTFAYGHTWETTQLPHRITHMVATHPLTRMRVAVGMETGGVVFTDGLEFSPVAEGLDNPLLGFTRGGLLIAAGKTEIRVYRMSGKKPEYLGSWPGYDFDASTIGAAIMPTGRIDEIALVSPSCLVQVFRIVAT